MSLQQNLQRNGINLTSSENGEYTSICPECSHTRKKKNDPCLSTKIDEKGATWFCHHCGWSGFVSDREGEYKQQATHSQQRRQNKPVERKIEPPRPLPEKYTAQLNEDRDKTKLYELFAARGISQSVVDSAKITVGTQFFGGKNDTRKPCIVFPFFYDGNAVNCKYRAMDEKAFMQTPNGGRVFYGMESITDSEFLIITEGEIDRLSLNEAGFVYDVLSVPDGAPAQVKDHAAYSKKFDFFTNCIEQLDHKKHIVLAVDNDDPGLALREELARRFGKERCFTVEWPTAFDAACKDANDVLVVHGKEALKSCITLAKPYPISGLHTASDYHGEVLDLYSGRTHQLLSTGWHTLDQHYRIPGAAGSLHIVTGVPNAGKSEVVDALLVNLAENYGWSFAICSFENPPSLHISKFAQKRVQKPFFNNGSYRMTVEELTSAEKWIQDHFYFIRGDIEKDTVDIDFILDKTKAAIVRHGIKGLVIDPYNEIEHSRSKDVTETEYVSKILTKVRQFAYHHSIAVWFIAHPQKMSGQDFTAVPSLYDISGSANWNNKADFGIVVSRSKMDKRQTLITIKKVRQQHQGHGNQGDTTLSYNINTGRYTVPSVIKTVA